MPNWIKIATTGALVCGLCASTATKTWEGYFCSNEKCPHHYDEPVRQNNLGAYWTDIRASLGTATASGTSTSTASPSAPPDEFS